MDDSKLARLLTSQDPRWFLPGAYIQFVRLDGKEFTDSIKSHKEIDGSLAKTLMILDETFQANISVVTDIASQSQEIRRTDYPIVALRELVYNAILHRAYEGTNMPIYIYWFSDRIQIHNASGLFGQVTSENLGQPGIRDYRNPHLAEAMKNLGYIRQLGLGIPLARKELEKNGNSPLEFDFSSPLHMFVTVRK